MKNKLENQQNKILEGSERAQNKEENITDFVNTKLIGDIFHLSLDADILILQKRIIKKIENENRELKNKEDLVVFLKDIFERLHNEDYIKDVFESGDKKKIKEIADYYNLSVEEVDKMEYYAGLRKQTIDKMTKDLEERKKSNPKFSDEENILGIYSEEIEPQVRDAVFYFNKKGYSTTCSGFWGEEYQNIIFKEEYFKDFKLSQDFLNKLKDDGAEIEVDPNMISFKMNKKLALNEIKNIWDKIAKESCE